MEYPGESKFLEFRRYCYNEDWETLPEFRGWLEKSVNDTDKAYCNVCKSELRSHKNDLTTHAKGFFQECFVEVKILNIKHCLQKDFTWPVRIKINLIRRSVGGTVLGLR